MSSNVANSWPLLPLLTPVSSAETDCNSGIACVESAAFYNLTAAAVSASVLGSLLNSGRGQPQVLEPGWTDGSLGSKSK